MIKKHLITQTKELLCHHSWSLLADPGPHVGQVPQDRDLIVNLFAEEDDW